MSLCHPKQNILCFYNLMGNACRFHSAKNQCKNCQHNYYPDYPRCLLLNKAFNIRTRLTRKNHAHNISCFIMKGHIKGCIGQTCCRNRKPGLLIYLAGLYHAPYLLVCLRSGYPLPLCIRQGCQVSCIPVKKCYLRIRSLYKKVHLPQTFRKIGIPLKKSVTLYPVFSLQRIVASRYRPGKQLHAMQRFLLQSC